VFCFGSAGIPAVKHKKQALVVIRIRPDTLRWWLGSRLTPGVKEALIVNFDYRSFQLEARSR